MDPNQITLTDIFSWIGGGSMITLAVAIMKYVRDSRDELRDIRKDLGRTDTPSPTGLMARVIAQENELKSIRDWAVRQGYDERK